MRAGERTRIIGGRHHGRLVSAGDWRTGALTDVGALLASGPCEVGEASRSRLRSFPGTVRRAGVDANDLTSADVLASPDR